MFLPVGTAECVIMLPFSPVLKMCGQESQPTKDAPCFSLVGKSALPRASLPSLVTFFQKSTRGASKSRGDEWYSAISPWSVCSCVCCWVTAPYTSWFKMLILVSWWASQLVVYRWFLNLYSSKSLTGLDYPEDDRCNWWLWLSDETWTGDQSTHKTPCVAQSPVSWSDFKIDTSRDEYSKRPGLSASYDLASKSKNVISTRLCWLND